MDPRSRLWFGFLLFCLSAFLFPVAAFAQTDITSLTLSPSSVVGGSTQAATGTVTIAPVSTVATTVGLSGCCGTLLFRDASGNPILSIVIPAGSTQGTFLVKAGNIVTTATAFTVQATVQTNRQATLTATPIYQSLSISPSSLIGGSTQNATGTVTLAAPLEGGVYVFLGSAPYVGVVFSDVPNGISLSQFVITAGQSSGTFYMRAALATATSITTTISATIADTKQASLTVNPVNLPNPDLGPCRNDCNAAAGEPINLTNGNAWVQQRDHSLPGVGGGLELVRTWNGQWESSSPVEVSGMFGRGWRSSYEERVVSGSPLQYWRADGSLWQFQYDSVNQTYSLIAPSDDRATIVFDSGTTLYTLTFADGSQRNFNNSGYLTKLIDLNGNQTTITYDGSNRITQITDAAARSVTFTYPSGSVRQVQSVQDSVGTIATYTYDASQRLTQVTYADASFLALSYDASNLLTSVNDTNGKVLEAHTYDGSRRALTSQRANGVQNVTVTYTSSTSTRVTDTLNNVTDYAFQLIGSRKWITQITGPGCSSCGGRGNGSFTFDSKGRRLTSTDALGRTTTYAYDIFNNVTSRSVQLNPQTTLTWSYTYNSLGQVLAATDPAGNTTTNVYDATGNLLSTTTPSPDGVAPGSTTSFTYDVKGQLTRVTDPRNNQTNIAYTAAGLIASVTDAQSNVTTYAYDARGNRTSVTDPLNNTSTFTYNNMNRLTQITQPGNVITSFAYDNRGRRISVTDANSKTTTNAYDDADRLTAVTDAASQPTGYTYDTESNLTRITDALGRQTNFAYDAYGRVTTVTFPSTPTETYAYDLLGNLTSKTDRKSQTITYTYDALNRLTRKQYPDTSGVDYTYDNLSRLTRVADATGTYDFVYDNLGRLKQTTTAYAFLTGRNFVVAYGYDAASNRTAMTDAEGGPTSYAYDSLNRVTSLTPPLDIAGGPFTFTYDALSRRTQLTRANNVTTSYTYDSLSRLLSVLHKLETTTLDGASYTVDNVGNRSSRTNQRNGTTSNYSYDALYELTQVIREATTTETYTYDPVGNRLTSLGISPYTYNASNQLTSRPGVTFTYDNNGSMLSRTNAGGVYSYVWDYENRLTSATLSPANGTNVTFKYDPFGRRIQKVSPENTTIYVYDGASIIEETNAAGSAVARYAQGLGIDEPLAMRRGSAKYYYHADGLGSITSLTNASGTVVHTYIYDSFGKPAGGTGTVTNPFRYTAREFDPETELYYYRARYYDRNLGRFLSEDPTELGALDENTNLYGYVENSPTNYVDPFGLYTVLPGVPAPSPEMDALLKCIEAKAGIALVVTSTSTISKQHPAGTPHARGVAADLRYPSDPDKVLCAAAGCGVGFGLDEKKHPSPNSTGPHIHLQIPAGKRGGHGDLPKNGCGCAQ